MHGVIPPQVQDPTFGFVEPDQVPLCPTFQPVQVTLNGSSIKYIYYTPVPFKMPLKCFICTARKIGLLLLKGCNKDPREYLHPSCPLVYKVDTLREHGFGLLL